MRRLALALLLFGCRTQPFSARPDAGVADLSGAVDLSGATDLSGAADLSSPSDLAAAPDLRRTLSFETSLEYHPGLSGLVAAGDFDEDGRSDLVAVFGGWNSDMTRSMGISLTHAGGAIGQAVTYPVSTVASNPVVADIDGDGHLDVVVVGARADGSPGVLFYRGRGDGTLVSPTDLDTGSGSFITNALALGDVDGDGRLDAVWNTATTYVSLGKGDGSFGPPATIESGARTNRVELGDVDGDHRIDVVYLVGGDSPSLHLARNLGGGRFTSPSPQPLPGASCAALADWDQDGALDVLVGTPASVDLHRGDGAGHFADARQIVALPFYPVPNPPALTFDIRVADLDHDGRPDLVANRSYYLSSYRQQADGTAQTVGRYAVNTSGTTLLVDLDGDGRLDLTDGLDVLLGLGDGSFHGAAYVPWAFLLLAQVTDLEGDGIPDLVGAGDGDQLYYTFRGLHNDGHEHFVIGPDYSANPGRIRSFVAAELDGDTAVDAVLFSVVNGATTGSLQLLHGVGDGSFVPAAEMLGTLPVSQVLVTADVDGDGRADVVALSSTSGEARSFLGTGKQLGPAHLSTGIGPLDSAKPIDFDGDGHLDLVTVDGTSGLLQLLRGDGKGGFTVSSTQTVTRYASIAAVADFDEDGQPDVALSVVQPVLLNRGGKLVPGPTPPYFPEAAADFDGDGHIDLVGPDDGATVMLGRGDGSFVYSGYFHAADGHVLAVDIDNDGRPDIVQCNEGCAFLRNTTH